MRRTAGWLGALALWAAALPGGTAWAQAGAGVPDVPAGEGVIRGRLLHDDPEAAEGLTVVLYSLTAEGVPGLRTTLSEAGGDFTFQGVSTDPGTVYVIGVRSGAVPFGSRLVFAEGETEAHVELHLTAPSADATAASPGESRIRFDRGCSLLRVNESHQLGNPTDRPILIPEEARAESEPLFRAELPEGAAHFRTALGSLDAGIVQEGRTVTYWGPLRPGGRALDFSYTLPAEPSRRALAWRFDTGVERLVVATHRNGVRVSGPALRPGPETTIEGRPYRTAEVGPLAPGAALDLALEVPEAPAPTDGISIPEVRLWLELDDAALSVDEQHHLEVPGGAPLQAETDAPLLCLPLPAHAQALRFSPASLELGLVPDPTGGLAVYGPLPAGASELALRYRLPSGEPPVTFERSFPRLLSRLSVLVADTHLRLDSDRLHRLRPVRGQTRTYLQLEGFEIEPDQPVSIRLTPMSPRQPLSKWALAGFAALATAGAIGFLATPLRGGSEALQPLATAATRAAAERESVYAAIRDLDDDLETGKVSPEDHARLRSELRAQAIALLEAERRTEAAPVAAALASDLCPQCRAQPPPDARFCAQCGAKLDRAPGEAGA